MKTKAKRTQDPLFFDHDMEHLNGGVQLLIDMLHDKGTYTVPLKNQAYLIYNMAVKEIYDPLIYEKFEANMKTTSSQHLAARHAYGALYAYYKSNQGTRFGIDFWESTLEDHLSMLHAQEVWQMLVAFRDNRQLTRQHMRDLIDSHYKQVLLDKWKAEVVYNQRVLFGLVDELHHLEYYDEELWAKIAETAV